MLFYLLIGCVLIAWCVDWTASRKHAGATVVIIFGAVVTLAMQRALLAYSGYRLSDWAFPLALTWDGIILAWIAYHVWTHCTPVTVSGVIAYIRWMFADSRRRSSVRAEVRRVARQYRVEVA